MLTNAYIMYVKVNTENFGREKKDLMTHLQFREKIAEYWINPDEFEREKKQRENAFNEYQRKRKRNSSSSCISSVTMDFSLESMEKKQKVGTRHINDGAMQLNGNLKGRLDRCLDHLPTEKLSNRARCALHRWLGIETSAGLVNCMTCGVHLCMKCYRLFHTEPDLLGKKKTTSIKIFEDKERIQEEYKYIIDNNYCKHKINSFLFLFYYLIDIIILFFIRLRR